MLERPPRDAVIIAAPTVLSAWRPVLFFLCVGLSMAGLIWLALVALSPGGIGAIDLILVVLFAVTLPWYVIGFWNATIGLLIMRFARDPVAAVLPVAGRIRADEPITASTAVLLCVRNEPPERTVRMLEPMLQGLAARGVGDRFHVYVLSDTEESHIAAAEDACFAALAAAWRGRIAVTYRRRAQNIAFKAGNIGEFCMRWGKDHDFAIMLDADSVMTVDLVLKLVRIMQIDPRLGILQTLVIGMPSASPFARIFQFGMRLGMRSYTIGSAWWQGDCGPYWGHNAIVRIAPFMTHCQLPVLGEGALVKGHVLSHDQIEAVLMRRAGYAVRVLAGEGSSFEQNPPTLVEFIRRDLRWCQGNMQYWHFLRMPGLRPVSRYQLAFAILMFLGSPAWIGLLLIGSAAAARAPTPGDFMRWDAGVAGLILVLAMWFAPNVATLIDVLTRAKLRHLFGGGVRFSASFMITVVFVVLLAPITWASHTLFLARLLCGRTLDWGAPARHDHEVPWSLALRQFWPQTLVGLAPVLLLAAAAPAALPYALLIAGGPLLSIPLAVLTGSPALGRTLIALGLDRLPEETLPPPELRALKLPAIEMSRRAS
ncbi:MAG: glucan biosynthesis glucosyltransferase H [Alphaproteobacteria bacterium 13_2_20CM_2_64_7]|jgi:membrane glycosyltransferase|nr:MAG: glucan biosynthesis glucosyltransferase H [Alphaproteobacteria bacterium 13_2_20CM_2_64_7]